MKIVESFITNNGYYNSRRTIKPEGIMLHSVGCAQPKASVFVKNYNKSSQQVCVHAFIDANDGTVYQTMPWTKRAQHCGTAKKGGPSANNTHIAVEMCEPKQIKYQGGATFTCAEKDLKAARTAASTAYTSAVSLFAKLCTQYKLDPLKDGVIISHKEGNLRGVASAHADPTHLWQGLSLGYTMDGFRKDVKAAMGKATASVTESLYKVRKSKDDAESQMGAFRSLENARNCANKNPGYKVFDPNGICVYDGVPVKMEPTKYQTTADVAILLGPGKEFAKRSKGTGAGVFTIVDKSGDFGLLKSYEKGRNGWIDLTGSNVRKL